MFLQELKDETAQEPIYLAVNTLSGAIDLFTEEEGKQLQNAITQKSCVAVSNRLFNFLVERGYIYPSKTLKN